MCYPFEDRESISVFKQPKQPFIPLSRHRFSHPVHMISPDAAPSLNSVCPGAVFKPQSFCRALLAARLARAITTKEARITRPDGRLTPPPARALVPSSRVRTREPVWRPETIRRRIQTDRRTVAPSELWGGDWKWNAEVVKISRSWGGMFEMQRRIYVLA